MGINIPTKEELIINHIPKDQLAAHLGADSVQYLSVQGLVRSVELMRTTSDGEGGDIVGKGVEEEDVGGEENGVLSPNEGRIVVGYDEEGNEKNDATCSSNGIGNGCGLKKGFNGSKGSHCTACLTGDYPIPPQAYADQF